MKMITRADFISGQAPNYPDMTARDNEGRKCKVVQVNLEIPIARVEYPDQTHRVYPFDDLTWDQD
jgi:hypothetical protein